MSRLHFLQVKYGDSFVIECSKGDNKGIIVVDGGPTGCGYILRNKLKEVGKPDLLILTHYDDDHIGGIIQLINSCRVDGSLPAKEIWANCANNVSIALDKTTSAKQGAVLSVVLNDMSESGEMIWHNEICAGFERDLSFASVMVLSPIKEVLDKAIEKQIEEGKQLLKATRRSVEDLRKPLEELALHIPEGPKLDKGDELSNTASIAFVLRCDGLSVLMLGDSYPHDVENFLRDKGYSENHPLEVDYVKISHHGSKNNTSNSLLDIIKCNNFLISTNGGKGLSNHPDRTAIAHILCHPQRRIEDKVHLFFNYKIDLIEANGAPFLNDEEMDKYNFEVHENITVL